MATLYSKYINFQIVLNFFIPNQFIIKKQVNIPKNVTLGNPEFHKPGQIAVLFGVEKFYDLLGRDRIPLGKYTVYNVKHEFWPATNIYMYVSYRCTLQRDAQILRNPRSQVVSEEDFQGWEFYIKITRCDSSSGRFIVWLFFDKWKGRNHITCSSSTFSSTTIIILKYWTKRPIQLIHAWISEIIVYLMPDQALINESSVTAVAIVILWAPLKGLVWSGDYSCTIKHF